MADDWGDVQVDVSELPEIKLFGKWSTNEVQVWGVCICRIYVLKEITQKTERNILLSVFFDLCLFVQFTFTMY